MAKAAEIILYREDGWTEDKIIREISPRRTIKDYAFILHDKDIDKETGEPKKPHYHLYVSFGDTSASFAHVAGWFNTSVQNVERVKGGRYAILRYYLHVDNPEKHLYSVDEIKSNFDVKKYLDKEVSKRNLDGILRKCAEGTITRLNYVDHIDVVTYSKHKSQIERAWEYHDASVYAAMGEERSMMVYWVWGPSSVGKTTLVKMAARKLESDLYIASQGNNPFDDYKSQHACCLDDLRPNQPYSLVDLLQILDNHTSREIAARYNNKYPLFEVLFVTSTLDPVAFFGQMMEPQEEAKQFYRRISEVWKVYENQIEISKYISSETGFQIIRVIDNPVPAFIQNQQKVQALGNRNLSQLIDEYNDKQLTFDGLFTELSNSEPIPFSA